MLSSPPANEEIGEKLFISEQTVKKHLHNVFGRLGVSDRLEFALYPSTTGSSTTHNSCPPSSTDGAFL